MEKSEKINEIAEALHQFQQVAENVVKDGTNPFFKSKYATLENVLAVTKNAMADVGLSFSQFPDGDGLYTLIMHKSGQWIGAHAAMELKGHTPQDQGSAITYLRRYALSAALGLATEDDDDGNAASKAKPVAAAKPVAPKKIADQREVQKKRIKDLIDAILLVPFSSGEEYKSYVKENTGYELVEENYSSIIDALEAQQH